MEGGWENEGGVVGRRDASGISGDGWDIGMWDG